MSFENKQKFALWVCPETLKKVENIYREDDCRSKSEFIERAIIFYHGYLTAQNNKTFLPSVITKTIGDIVGKSTEKLNRVVFKLAVEIAIMQNLIALNENIDPVAMERLRGECVYEVKRLNGSFRMEDALEWQCD